MYFYLIFNKVAKKIHERKDILKRKYEVWYTLVEGVSE